MAQPELLNSLKSNHKLHWYRIDKVLGQGGFGITYLAHDPNLDQLVAIKEYLPMELAVRDGDNSVYPASSANGDRYKWGLDRFIVEARTLARFKHPAIVRVLSVFEENNTAYMVMEYENGESLQAVLDRRKTLHEAELIPILAPLLDGLELIHQAGFIHRDIKPANIYIRADNTPVLLDFGSARQALGEQTKSLTSIVSPGYAPFEQYYSKSDRQGPWTDIYALAATMYRAISGVMPMDSIDRSEAILKAERDIFVSAGEIGEGRYSPGFMRALDHALNFNEKKRPQTVAEWREELGIDPTRSGVVSMLRETPLPDPQEIETIVADPQLPSIKRMEEASERSKSIHYPPMPATAARAQIQTRGAGLRWVFVLALLGAIFGGVYYASQLPAAAPWFANLKALLPNSAQTDALDEARKLVARGDRALSAGQVIDPIKDSAVDFYRRAIALDPNNDGARQGLSLTVSRLRAAIELAIANGELEQAAAYLRLLATVPGEKEAHEALVAALEEATSDANVQESQRQKIAEFLNEAATDFAENRLLEPSGDNALVRYRAVQMLDPNNADAKRGIAAIVSRLIEQHEAAMAAGDLSLASTRLDQLEPLAPNNERVAGLRQALAAALQRDDAEANKSDRIAELLGEAAADVQANRLGTPSGRNAVERYREVLSLSPNNEAAHAGLKAVAERYLVLANGAIKKDEIERAKRFIASAQSLDASNSRVGELLSAIKTQERQQIEQANARSLEQERERLAEEARRRQEQERMRFELETAKEAAEIERRRRQEAEAKRLFELEQAKHRAAQAQKAQQDITAERSTLVVEFDGFSDQTEINGLKRSDLRADIEAKLRSLGYRVVLHHEANRSQNTRLFVIKFRANMNAASGVFSYATSLLLYDHVPVKANSSNTSGMRPAWEKGTTGVASQTDLRLVREEYNRTMRKFVTEVGQAPGRL